MSTLKTTNIAHPSSASNNIVLDNSGNVVLQAGTAAAPALQPSGDTNTGVLFPAADTVAISTGGSERVRCDSSGRVGIGTTPSYKLDVDATIRSGSSGSPGSIILTTSGATEAGWMSVGPFNWHGGSDFAIGAGTSKALLLGSNNAERARIDTSGRLLVGTSTLAFNERLSLARTDTTTNSIVCNIYNSASTSTSKTANALLRVSSNASGADAYINITDNTSHNYNFGGNNGGAYVVANNNGVRLSNGGTSWASDSDERVKKIIDPIENGLNKVSTLRAVIGRYKTDDEDKRRSFLIAQDVQAVLPEAVYDEQGTLMLAYTDTIPLLVAALKESKERIEQLEAKVSALEAA